MTKAEFAKWIAQHSQTFDVVRMWIAQDADGAALDNWHRVLSPVILDDAVDATRAMLAGTIECPRMASDHPRIILGFCADQRKRRKQEQFRASRSVDTACNTYACPWCQDCGWVVIWHHDSMASAVVCDDPEDIPRLRAAVRCTCEAAPKIKDRPEMRFDKKRMAIFHQTPPAQLQRRIRESAAQSVGCGEPWNPQGGGTYGF